MSPKQAAYCPFHVWKSVFNYRCEVRMRYAARVIIPFHVGDQPCVTFLPATPQRRLPSTCNRRHLPPNASTVNYMFTHTYTHTFCEVCGQRSSRSDEVYCAKVQKWAGSPSEDAVERERGEGEEGTDTRGPVCVADVQNCGASKIH